MTLQTIPDLEAIVGAHLRAHPDIVALNTRVAGRTPGSMTNSWVRVTQLDAADSRVSQVEHLIDFPLQLDCYAGSAAMDAHSGQTQASLLARTVRAVLKSMEGQSVGGVVVTRVRFNGMPRLPDTTFEPARERFVLTAEIMVHAVSA